MAREWESELRFKRQYLRARGLKPTEIEIVISPPPKRGTMAWDYREMLRKRLGHHCISFGDL